MHPYINLFGKPFSTYGVAAFIGMLAAVLYSFIMHKAYKEKKDFFSRFLFVLYCAIFGGIGAAFVFQLTVIKGNLEAIRYLFSDFQKCKELFSFGLVFYGGMLGMFVGFMVYSQYFKEDTRGWLRTSVAGIPLFHMFGRIGCSIGGCCFGKVVEFNRANEMNELGIFDHGDLPLFHDFAIYNERIGAYCIPIQLIEAAGIFVIFLIVLLYTVFQKNKENYYRPIGVYFVLYGLLRSVTEYFRGDLNRGIWGPYSTSQYISMFVVPFGIYCLVCPTSKNFLEKWYNGELRKKKAEAKKALKEASKEASKEDASEEGTEE